MSYCSFRHLYSKIICNRCSDHGKRLLLRQIASLPHRRWVCNKRYLFSRMIGSDVSRIVAMIRCQDHKIIFPQNLQQVTKFLVKPFYLDRTVWQETWWLAGGFAGRWSCDPDSGSWQRSDLHRNRSYERKGTVYCILTVDEAGRQFAGAADVCRDRSNDCR